MGQVWELKLDHATCHILLGMADHARDDGSRCFPSVGYLAWKTNYSIRQVQRIVSDLEDKAIIIPVAYIEGGRGHATEYQIVLSAAERKPSYNVEGTDLSGNLRIATIARFNGVCQYCEQVGTVSRGPDGTPWHIDRITPAKEGGMYTPDNVTLSCAQCNQQKGAKLTPPRLSPKGAIDDIETAPMAPQPLNNHQEPIIEPPIIINDYPEWFKLCLSITGWRETYEQSDKWRQGANISIAIAQSKASALTAWFTEKMLKAGKNPYKTWQHWCRDDKGKKHQSNNR